jgi:hypothetical protein
VHLISRPLRALLVAALLVPVAMPAFAGPNETAFLERLVGTWRGKGEITGPDAGKVACRLTFKAAGERLNFNGRCTGGGGGQSFSGVIRYNDAKGRYESTSRGTTVAGKKSGSSLVFASTQKESRGTVTSTMTLSPSALKVQFKAVDARSGEASNGTIPFSKS